MRTLAFHTISKDRGIKPKRFLLSALFLLILCSATISQDGFTKTILYSNKNLQLFILCRDTASFDQTDWLQIGIRNLKGQAIFIQNLNYALNNPRVNPKGDIIPNFGAYGEGNKFDIFQCYHELINPSDHFRNGIVIDAYATVMSWKHISDYAAVSLEPFANRTGPSHQVCPKVELSISYRTAKKVKEIKITEGQFCFYWNMLTTISDTILLQRFRDAINSPNRTTNLYVISRLMKEKSLVQLISTPEFIEAICRDTIGRGEFVNVKYLDELAKRNALPDSQLTIHYSKQLTNNYFPDGELIQYWDDRLFDDILQSNTYYLKVANLLERTVDHWKNDPIKRRIIYNFLQSKTKFDPTALPHQADFADWSKALKLMSISRDTLLISYLITLLNNEQAFDIADWSKYKNSGARGRYDKPDTISVRICDIAFICLLRVLDQTYLNNGVRINQQLIPLHERINIPPFYSNFNIGLSYTEKYFRLSPGIKKALLTHVNQMEY